MRNASDIVTISSSLVLRLSAFVFLRWIPGHLFPPVILTSLAVYLGSILLNHRYLSPSWQKKGLNKAGDTHRKHGKLVDETTNADVDSSITYQGSKATKIRNVLLSGLPHRRLQLWSTVTIAINVVVTLFSIDLVFRGPVLYPENELRFSRLGFVDATSAKVLFREPCPKKLPVYAHYKADDSTAWNLADRIYYLGEETDYTYPVTFSPLRPGTSYTYSLSNELTGNFTTPPAPASSGGRSLTFATSSCIKANFPYSPLNHALEIGGLKHLSRILGLLPGRTQFMLFLGDFIYVDVPLRLSSTAAHYRAEYRRVYASPSWSLPRLRPLPWLHTLDDHEIANDWASGNNTAPYPSARDPFRHYHVSVNPPTPPQSPSPRSNISYFQFSQGPAAFFMLDTRAYRTQPFDPSNPSLSNPDASILGNTQLSSLLTFLQTPEPAHVHWKIIASSVPFTKNWRFGSTDTWAGFPAERATVLDAMHHAERHLGIRVIILSGDRHEFGAIRYPHPSSPPSSPSPSSSPSSDQPSLAVQQQQQQHNTPPTPAPSQDHSQSGPHEFSVGPLSMFYLPFPFRTFRQTDDEDVAVKYVPDGNSKVGIVRIDSVEGDGVKSLLRYSLYVDGGLEWEYVLASP